MKAKIKETGEVIDVIDCGYSHSLNEKIFLDSNKRHKVYFPYEIELMEEQKTMNIVTNHTPVIDWEQRRYELAKAAMQGMLANPSYHEMAYVKSETLNPSGSSFEFYSNMSIALADTLIKKLKKVRQE